MTRDGRSLIGRADAEAHADRQFGVTLDALDMGAHGFLGRRTRAGDAQHRDEIDEARGILQHRRQALVVGGGGRQQHGVDAGRDRVGLEFIGLFRRQVDQDETVDTGGGGILAEALGAALVDEIVVAHQQDRRVVVAGFLAKATHHVEGRIDGDARLQRTLTGELDRRAVGHRIGEGHAEFDEIRAGRRQALQYLVADVEVGIAGRDVGDETGPFVGLESGEALGDAAHGQIFIPRRSATAKTSLSPRPQRFITSRLSFGKVGASLITCPRA